MELTLTSNPGGDGNQVQINLDKVANVDGNDIWGDQCSRAGWAVTRRESNGRSLLGRHSCLPALMLCTPRAYTSRGHVTPEHGRSQPQPPGSFAGWPRETPRCAKSK